LNNKANESSKPNLPWQELFNDAFMKQYSSYDDLQKFFQASGFKIENAKDFQQVPEDQWEEFVKKNTSFNSWEEMLSEAGKSWIKKKLGL
jgi:hypothetical protein